MRLNRRASVCVAAFGTAVMLAFLALQLHSLRVVRLNAEELLVLPDVPRTKLSEQPISGSDRPAAVRVAQVPETAVKSLLTGRVSRRETEDVYAFLRSASIPSGMTSSQVYALKNNLLNTLRYLEDPPADLTQEMIRLCQDTEQDVVIRHYALQHLGLWYDQIAGVSSPGQGAHHHLRPASEAAAIRGTLWTALTDREGGTAGTALLAFYNLCRSHPDLDMARVSQAALEMVEDERCSPLARTSAIQVCGRMGLREVLPLAARLAVNAPTVSLQAAAIATLGDIGGEEERLILLKFLESGDPRLRVACESALKRIAMRVARGQESA